MLACLGARHLQTEYPVKPKVKRDQSKRHCREVSGTLCCSLAACMLMGQNPLL